MRPRVVTRPAKATTATTVLKATYPAAPSPFKSTASGKEADIQVLRSFKSKDVSQSLRLPQRGEIKPQRTHLGSLQQGM